MNRREALKTFAAAGAVLAAGRLPRTASAQTKKSVTDTPVILECAVNGSTTKAINPLAPETVEEQTAEIIRCLDAGATIVHLHSNKPNPDPKIAAEAYAQVFPEDFRLEIDQLLKQRGSAEQQDNAAGSA